MSQLDKETFRTLKPGDTIDVVCEWYNGITTVRKVYDHGSEHFYIVIDHRDIRLMVDWLGKQEMPSCSVIARADGASLDVLIKRDLRLQEEAYYEELINS